jgi:hypothetical protein
VLLTNCIKLDFVHSGVHVILLLFFVLHLTSTKQHRLIQHNRNSFFSRSLKLQQNKFATQKSNSLPSWESQSPATTKLLAPAAKATVYATTLAASSETRHAALPSQSGRSSSYSKIATQSSLEASAGTTRLPMILLETTLD